MQGIDVILLDNMSPAQMSEALALRNKLAPAILLEASGGVTLATIPEIAATGVDRISVGALTHSATNADLSLEMESPGHVS
jgi:nicotinate-nucleotide pyrophosphorylase (carboxylating)